MEPTLVQLVGGALMLNRAAYEAIERSPSGTGYALIVVVLAGMSEGVGQSAVLFLNQVARSRFVFAIVSGGVGLAFEALIWTVGMWLVAAMLHSPRPSLVSAQHVTGLAFSPLLFGFLVFLPTLGVLVARLLRVWVFLAAVVGATVVFALPAPAAALTAAAGLLARPLVLYVEGRLSAAISRYRWRGTAQSGQTKLPPP